MDQTESLLLYHIYNAYGAVNRKLQSPIKLCNLNLISISISIFILFFLRFAFVLFVFGMDGNIKIKTKIAAYFIEIIILCCNENAEGSIISQEFQPY